MSQHVAAPGPAAASGEPQEPEYLGMRDLTASTAVQDGAITRENPGELKGNTSEDRNLTKGILHCGDSWGGGIVRPVVVAEQHKNCSRCTAQGGGGGHA